MTAGAFAVPAATLAGAAGGSLVALLPGFHVLNLLALVLAVVGGGGAAVAPEVAAAFTAAALAAWATASTLPSILLSAPDESAFLMLSAGQSRLLEGRGHEAVLASAAGALGGAVLLVPVALLALPRLVPPLHAIVRPHLHWVVWCVIAFMLQSEWPKGGTRGAPGWRRLADALAGPASGAAAFVLSGLLGFVLFFKSPLRPEDSFQGLAPAFIGLFAVPWLVTNLASRARVPPQRPAGRLGAGPIDVASGVLTGALGGGFAAFVPAVTGGVGAMLAGHALAGRDDRSFLVSQGATRMVYYGGALLLSLMPGVVVTRGGAAWMLHAAGEPSLGCFRTAAAALLAGAGLAFVATEACARLAVPRLSGRSLRRLSAGSLAALVALVAATTGLPGLAVLAVASGIGMVPVAMHSRRMNSLGIVLLPLACSLSGFGDRVAGWLGLL